MTEVMLIVALVGVATIGVVGVLGNNTSAIASASAQTLAGQNAKANTEKADQLHRTLANFGDNEAAAANMDGNYSGMESGLTGSGGKPSNGLGGKMPGTGVIGGGSVVFGGAVSSSNGGIAPP